MSFTKKKRAKFSYKDDKLNFEINLHFKKDLYFYLTFVIFLYVLIYGLCTLLYTFFQILKIDFSYVANTNLLISDSHSTMGQIVSTLNGLGFKSNLADLIFFLQLLL